MQPELSVNRAPSNAVFWVLLILVIALGVVLRLHRIGEQPPLFDEVLAVVGAESYVEHGQFGPIMVYHPQWRSLALYATTHLAGTGALGVRGASLFLGCLAIPLLTLLILRMTSDRWAALITGFLLAIDPVHITFSRQAIQEVHTTFFFIAGVLLFVEGRRRRDSVAEPVLWALAGVAFGLGMASKAHALFPLAVCGGLALGEALADRRTPSRAVSAVASFGLLPASVYLLSYLPWFGRGYGLSDWVFMQRSLFGRMVTHSGNPMDSLVDTSPALWFIKPFMGYGNFVEAHGQPMVTIAMGNPLVWLLVLPAIGYLVVRRRDQPGVMLLLALFLASYLPLVLTTRPVWVLSSMAVTPFAFGLVGLTASQLIRERRLRAALVFYLALVLLVSLLMYPMSVGRGWHHEYLRPLVVRFIPH
jgi:dolichyl-phosphate-mannose--protein O-mannosyl transferase